jgi:CBS domain-containing protein
MATVRDFMTTSIETVTPDQTAMDAAAFMLSADTGAIPVCDNDKVIGMITDRDIAVRGVAAGKGPECSVRELMSSDIVYARESDDVDTDRPAHVRCPGAPFAGRSTQATN